MNNIFPLVNKEKFSKSNEFDNGFSIIKEYEPDIINKLKISNNQKYYFVLRLWNQTSNKVRVTITHGYAGSSVDTILWDDSFINSFYKLIDFDIYNEYYLNNDKTKIIDKKGRIVDVNKLIDYLYQLNISLFMKGHLYLKFKYLLYLLKIKIYHNFVSLAIRVLNIYSGPQKLDNRERLLSI